MHKIIVKGLGLAKKISHADIVRVFSLTSISTLVRMCTGLVSVKVVASIIGPAGVALVGQLNSFVSMVNSFSSGCINNGVTKYVAEYKSDEDRLRGYLSAGLRITVVCSLICAAILILFAPYISKLIMLSDEYSYVFRVYGLTVLLYALNNYLLSIINGFKEFRKFVYVNIANSVIGVLFTVLLVMTWGLSGALISAVTYQSIMLFVSLWMVRRCGWLKWWNFKDKIRRLIVKDYFKYSLMALVSAICVPVVQMFLRGYVIAEISATEAGWWEGMNRISNMYLMVITSSFGVYYLPRLSELKSKIELRKEIFKSYAVIIPSLVLGFTIIYFLRFFIIKLLFTEQFIPMQSLFIWQLLGDFFKISSWLLAFLMLAKAMTKIYISTEIIFTLTYLGMGYLFVRLNGIVGLCQAYLVNYVLYLGGMLILFKKVIKLT